MTPQQNACLIAIRDLTVDGVSPTHEQIQFRLGLSSKSGVNRLLVALEERGHIRRLTNRARSIEIIERNGGGISDARIAAMSDDALDSAHRRIGAAIVQRRAKAQSMEDRAI